jgi:hypothetical protein
VNVVKKAQTRTAITAMPPGNQANKDLNNRTSRSPARLSERRNPVSVKSGMAAIENPVSMA